MSTLKKELQTFSVFVLGVALLVAGCAKPAEDAATRKRPVTPAIQASGVTQEVEAPTHELVGIWWGTGALDDQSLALAMEGLSFETQQQVSVAAKSFLATEMAIEFKADGTMETAVEVLGKSGQRESGVSLASWEATPTVNSGEFRVSAVEVQADGSTITDLKTYRVSADGQSLELLVDLSGLLGQCRPRILLQRQEEISNVASQQSPELR